MEREYFRRRLSFALRRLRYEDKNFPFELHELKAIKARLLDHVRHLRHKAKTTHPKPTKKKKTNLVI
jgi:hypothetical protein